MKELEQNTIDTPQKETGTFRDSSVRKTDPGRKRRKKKAPLGYRIFFVIMILIGASCAFGIGAFAGMMVNKAEDLRKLAETVRQAETLAATSTPTTPDTETTIPSTDAATVPTEEVEKTVLLQYKQIYEENPELFGWIKIDDTRIDYPVMHTPDDPEKYLHADYNGDYSYPGLPFLDAACTEESDNLLVYGHNMLDGSMFRSLMQYENKDYWQKHPVIKFDTLYETQEYEVMAAFYDRVYYKTEKVFKFYQFINAENENDYNTAVAEFQKKAIYDTGVTASYGDQLLTLVTCAYHTDNGRFVVVARKIT